ncbi:MAG: hypothetical protein ACLUD2_15525 [Clostridium sp.]
MKTKSEKNPEYRNFVIKPISYTTFDGKPYYINVATDYSKIHIGVKADAYVNPSVNFKEYDDCYEIPVGVIYYTFPLVPVDEYDNFAGTNANSNFRFTKDAKISYINWDTYRERQHVCKRIFREE